MGNDDDLARLLPDPPAPRPAGRDAAIAAAMRRFDGVPDPVKAPAAPRWSGRQWGPVGAFASILLVALIAIPLALRMPFGPPVPPPAQPAAPHAPAPAPAGTRGPVAPPAPQPQTAGPAAPASPVARAGTAPAVGKPGAAPAAEPAYAPEPMPLPAPAPVPVYAPEPTPSESQDVVVTAQRARAPQAATASPVTVIDAENLDDARGNDSIVVTGTARRTAKMAYRRGDWNACTVDDPEQSLRGCGHLVNPGAKGEKGVAGAHLADGLALAWRRDWSGAIAAFDQAIALQPKLAFAYLNRGLAYRQSGDETHAAADLDNAVRYARYAARGYYQRGLLRRQTGDMRGANADQARAESLDSRYADLAE